MTIHDNSEQFDVTFPSKTHNIRVMKTIDQVIAGIKSLNSHTTFREEVLTFEQVKEYFKTQTPDIFGIKKAAIYKQKHPRGYMIALLFINNNDEIAIDENGEAYGRIILAKSLDQNLKKILSATDFVIFK